MLETCRVGRVTGDGYIHILLPHDGNAFAHIVSAIAANAATNAVRVLCLGNNLNLSGIIVKLGLNVSKSVDAGNNLCSILSESVQDDAKRFLTNLVGHLGNLDSSLCGSIRLMSGKECKAACLLAKQSGSKITMSQTYLTVICNRSRDTERLKALADGFSGLCCVLDTLLDSDGCTCYIRPLCVLKADFLGVLTHLVWVDSLGVADSLCLFEVFDSVFVESCIDLVNTTLVTFKKCHKSLTLYVGQYI